MTELHITKIPEPIADVRLDRTYVALTLLLLTMSAVWVQTDLYRYSVAPILVWGFYSYIRTWTVKPRFHWLEILCLVWAGYVAGRLGASYVAASGAFTGRSEGLYLSPILFGVLGYALFRLNRLAPNLLLGFFAVSLAMLASSMDFSLLFSTETYAALYQSNSIHAAVSAGLILIGAIGWLVYCTTNRSLPAPRRVVSIAIAVAVIGYSLLAVLGANSKGVWLALSLVVVAEAILLALSVPARRHKLAVAVPVVVMIAVGFALRDRLMTVAFDTLDVLMDVVVDAVASGDPLRTLQVHIDAHSAPESAQIRLELLYNALTVWRQNFWFGAGPFWADMMTHAPYPAGGFTTIHNAFLEIAVRYGLLGLVAVGVIVLGCLYNARSAGRRGLLPRVAVHTYAMLVVFYLTASLTNSNSHQAFGEVFVLLSCGFGLSCLFMVRADEARTLANPAVESRQQG